MVFLIAVGSSVIVAIAVALFCDWRWPSSPIVRLALLSGLAMPLLLAALIVAGLVWVGGGEPCPPESMCDADGMVVAGLILVGGAWVAISFLLGLPAAWLTLRYMRRP
ncbi:MAG TPA: hypothetical protein VFQ67_04280 [Allosphingosinicella sp.]|nr:hypothetical protein [Allosphingosinicella sp.]